MADDVPAEWLPIDGAPKGEDILVFTAAWGPIIANYSEEFGEWLSRMQVPVSLKQDDDLPTHWLPLPSPPVSEASADGPAPAN